MKRESYLVLGAMTAVVLLLVAGRLAYDDIVAYLDAPTAAQAAQGEQALQDMQQFADANDPMDLIATVAACRPGHRNPDACLTVTGNWARASNRLRVVTDLWQGWSELCTGHRLAEKPSDCRIELHAAQGEKVGGSGEGEGSRIWVKE